MMKPPFTQHIWRISALALASTLALNACGNKVEEMKKEQMGKMASIEPIVNVFTVQPANILLDNHLPGRLESFYTAKITPQATGIVKKRFFHEGALVKQGDLLYEIDGATYEATLQTAQANLLGAEAALAKANTDVERYRPLVEADAISKQEWDAALAAKRAAEAQIASAQAAINAAQVNVNYTKVLAPISGRIGQSLVTEGALVNANTTQMAVITQNDPMYVNITQSSNEMLKLRQQIMSGQKVPNPEVVVSLTLEDGSEYPHKGRLLFIDSNTDEKTGQVTLRAAVPNPNHLLLNGMYVRVNLPQVGILGAFPVPKRAITRGKTDSLNIAKEDGTVEPRTVKINGQKDDFWLVTEGLKEGDKVVVDGLAIANMMKGMGASKFKFQEWQPENPNNPNNPDSEAESTSSPDNANEAPTLPKQEEQQPEQQKTASEAQ